MKSEPFFDNFEGLAFKKINGNLSTKFFYGYESRNQSTQKMMIDCLIQFGVQDFDWIVVGTGDVSTSPSVFGRGDCIQDDMGNTYKYFSYSTGKEEYSNVIPDFVFDHWRQTGLEDYESTRNILKRLDFPASETNLLGWRGALTHPSRTELIKLDDKINFDCEVIEWNRENPEKLSAHNFLTFEEQVSRWRYLIDLQGRGYSGRLKLLLCSQRLVFVQNRMHKEFYFPYLKEWVHFVPVKEDLSDLVQNLQYIKSRPDLELSIIRNARAFAQKNLSRDYALFHLAKCVNEYSV